MYVNSTAQRCPNKIIKTILIEDFFPLPSVSTTPVVHLELRISPRMRIFEIQNGPSGILRGLGETETCKTLKSKISWHCPFKLHPTCSAVVIILQTSPSSVYLVFAHSAPIHFAGMASLLWRPLCWKPGLHAY
jgi:hypothetical protein